MDLILDLASKPAQVDYPESSGTLAIFQKEDIGVMRLVGNKGLYPLEFISITPLNYHSHIICA